MKIIQNLLTMGQTNGRTGQKLIPKGIVIHYVGNPNSTAVNNRNYFESGSGGNGVSAHYIVGLQGEIVQCVPETECAQHAGKSYGTQWEAQAKKNNSTYMGIEVCHPDASGKFNVDSYSALVELCADICTRYNFTQIDVYRHYDVTGKKCPMYYVNNQQAWETMLVDIGMAIIRQNNPHAGILHTPSDWAMEAWAWGIKNGITDGTFPKDNCTREQIVAMLYRFSKLKI